MVLGIYTLSSSVIENAIVKSVISEGGNRAEPYNLFKWWSRRFSILSRLLAASLLTASEDELLKVIEGNIPSSLMEMAKGKLIYDPFCGAGTIVIEATRLGFDAVGIDINRIAILIAEKSYNLLCKRENLYSCLLNSLKESLFKTWNTLKDLWVIDGRYLIVHTLLSRCPPCKAPIWVCTRSTKRVKKKLVIDEKTGKLIWVCNEALTPKEPSIDLSKKLHELPEVSKNLYAYAVELMDLKTGQRFFISLLENNTLSKSIKEHITWSSNYAYRLLRSKYAEYLKLKVPLLKETKRLYRYNIKYIHELFTPRQLVSLLEFIHNTDERFKDIACLIAGNVARTASILAMYYQPYSKVNPGLQIKSYWLPQNPVELNPLAHFTYGSKIRTMGRGTISTYLSKIEKTYRSIKCEYLKCGKLIVKHSDCTQELPPPDTFAVITDPPYPGHFNYQELSLLYEFFFNYSHNTQHHTLSGEINVFNENEYIIAMESLAIKLSTLKPGVPLIFLIGIKSIRYVRTVRKLVETFFNKKIYLTKIYWFIGESYGKLGRSKSRGIFILIFTNKKVPINISIDIVRDLYEAKRIIKNMAKHKFLSKLLDPEYECKIVDELQNSLASSQVLDDKK